MTWQEDQERLAEAFRGESVVAEKVNYLESVEHSVAERTLSAFGGTALIADCFQDLIISSYSLRRRVKRIANVPQLCIFLSAFRALRASYKTFWSGYYFEAAGGLRGLLENIYVLAAFAKGRIGQEDLGMENRGRVAHAIAGKNSSLDVDDQEAIKELKDILGMHVHGSKVVMSALCLRAAGRKGLPSVEPYFHEVDASHYAQVSICLSWALLRLWTTLPDSPRGGEWDTKYRALDDAFRSHVRGWDRPVAVSIMRWVDTVLDFSGVPIRYPSGQAEEQP